MGCHNHRLAYLSEVKGDKVMLRAEKMALLEELLELDTGTLNEGMELRQAENWDSMAAISLIALVDEYFHKSLSAEQIKKFITIGDVLNFMS